MGASNFPITPKIRMQICIECNFGEEISQLHNLAASPTCGIGEEKTSSSFAYDVQGLGQLYQILN